MERSVTRRWVSLLFVCALCSLQPAMPGRAQAGDGVQRNYTVEYWTQALAVQGDVLWVGTDAGLLRWDLTTDTITKYTPADGLLGFKIHDVTLDAQGRVWVGHEWGLSVLQGSAWTNYHRDNSGIPGDDVYQVAVAGDGTVWLYSRDRASGVGLGLTEFDGSMSWYTYTEGNSDLPDDRVDSIGLDNDDHLWVGTGDGAVAVFDGATWTVYNDPTYNHNSVNVVGPDPSGRMWFTSYYNTAQPVLMFDGAWHLITPESGCDGGVRQGAFDGSGTLWLTTWSGLCSYAGSTWTRYHEVNSDLLYDRLETIAAQGSAVWVGYGPDLTVEPVTITEFNGSAWDHHHKDRILPRGLGQGLAVDHDGQKWFGLMNKGVGMFDGDTWTAYDDTNSGLPDTCTVIIAVDLEGHLWFAGSLCAGGLVEYDGVDDWTQHYGAGVPHSWVQAVAVDQANRVWAGSPAGLSYYDGMGWYTYNESNSGLPNNNVSRIVVDAEAHIWVGCNTRFDGVTWEEYASPEAAIEASYDDIVDTFYQDYRCWVADPARGKVWRNNSISGVKAYNGAYWEYYSYSTMDLVHPGSWVAWPQGLDGAGNLWVVASDSNPDYGGVSRFDGANWTGYRQADGLLEPPNFAFGADDDNRVWFANGSGLSEFFDPWQPTQALVTQASGGKLTSADGSTTVTFPPGAVSQDMLVTLTPLQPSPTGALVGIGHFFELAAAPATGSALPAITFEKSYTLTVDYTPEELGSAIEDTLGLYWSDGGHWILEATSSLSMTVNRVTATPGYMALFAVLGETNRVYLPLVMRGG